MSLAGRRTLGEKKPHNRKASLGSIGCALQHTATRSCLIKVKLRKAQKKWQEVEHRCLYNMLDKATKNIAADSKTPKVQLSTCKHCSVKMTWQMITKIIRWLKLRKTLEELKTTLERFQFRRTTLQQANLFWVMKWMNQSQYNNQLRPNRKSRSN